MSHLNKKEGRLAVALLSPSLLILLFIAFFPLASVLFTSFTDRTFASSRETSVVGFDNYVKLLRVKIFALPLLDDGSGEYADPIDILPRKPIRYKTLKEFSLFGSRYVLGATDPDFLGALGDTVSFTFLSVTLELIFGMIVALILLKTFPGRGALRVAMLVPWAIPTAVSSRMWEWMFASSRVGIINVISQWFGFTDGQFPFLIDSSTQIGAIVLIDVWKTTPFMALLFLAGLQQIPRDMYEAADIDGCGPLRSFWKITLPLLKPTMMVALIFRTLDALRVFDLFQIVFAQKRYSLSSFAYYQLIDNKMMGYSSAASVLIFLVIFGFNILYIKGLGGVGHDE